jgi:two-component system, NarL family, nitrate/nitrite response regulator NarL
MIVDEHELFLYGVRIILSRSGAISVVSESRYGLESLAKYRESQPEVVIIGINAPRYDGRETVRLLHDESPEAKLLVLSDSEKPFIEVIKLGAKGFLLKNVGLEVLIDGIQSVKAGKKFLLEDFIVIPPGEQERTMKTATGEEVLLSAREKEILRLIISGMRTNEIAEALDVRAGVVSYQIRVLLKKLHVKTRREAAIRAYREEFRQEE